MMFKIIILVKNVVLSMDASSRGRCTTSEDFPLDQIQGQELKKLYVLKQRSIASYENSASLT